MTEGLIFRICLVWFIFLVPIGFIGTNLSIGIWRAFKRIRKKSEQGLARGKKKKIKVSHWKPELDNVPTVSTE